MLELDRPSSFDFLPNQFAIDIFVGFFKCLVGQDLKAKSECFVLLRDDFKLFAELLADSVLEVLGKDEEVVALSENELEPMTFSRFFDCFCHLRRYDLFSSCSSLTYRLRCYLYRSDSVDLLC